MCQLSHFHTLTKVFMWINQSRLAGEVQLKKNGGNKYNQPTRSEYSHSETKPQMICAFCSTNNTAASVSVWGFMKSARFVSVRALQPVQGTANTVDVHLF
jgi:hypothetical protein